MLSDACQVTCLEFQSVYSVTAVIRVPSDKSQPDLGNPYNHSRVCLSTTRVKDTVQNNKIWQVDKWDCAKDPTTRKDFGCQNSGTKTDLVRTCFKDGKWTVAGIEYKEESNGDNRESGWTMYRRTWRQGNFISNDLWPSYKTASWRRLVAASSSFLKWWKRQEGLDTSKTCCLHGPWLGKPIDQTRNYLYL